MDGPSSLLLSPKLQKKRKRKRRRMPSRSSSSRRPASRPKPRWSEPPPGLFPAGAHDFLRLLAVLAIAAAAAAACSLLSRRPNPFCDSQHHDAAYDSCEPCPLNGRCVHGKLECLQGFKKHGKICIEDGLLTQTANKISDLLRLTICDEHARALCGQSGKILFQQLDISNLADDLLSKDHAHLSDDGIKLVKDRVLDSTLGFLETVSTYDKVEAFKCPELVAEHHRPLSCQVRQWILRNIISVVTSCILFAALLWILWSIYHRRAFSKRAEQIYEQVCEILEDNAINVKIGNSECEPWVVTSWLRDHLLATRERRNAVLWKKVEELILEDSRIDQYQKVIKGESKVVFEWQASGSLSGKIKKMQQGQGGTGISRRSNGVGAIRLGEEMDGSGVGEVKDRSRRKEGTEAFLMT